MKKLKTEARGAILVIAPALILCILTIMAVAIDINYIYASKEQMQQYTKFVSLAAIEQYFAEECVDLSDGTAEGTVACNNRRNEKIGDRLHEVIPQYLLLNKTITMDAASIRDDGTVIETPNGIKTKYTQGRWVTDATKLSAGQRCDDGTTTVPCFRKEDLSYEGINAFKIETEFPFSMAARLTGPLLGVVNRPIVVTAVASVTPRRTCVLIDTSGSLTRETHLPQDDLTSTPDRPASEFAFFLNTDNPSASRHIPHEKRWHGYAGGAGEQSYIGVDSPAYRNRPTGSTDPKIHYASDYIGRKTLNDFDYPKLKALYGDKFEKLHPNDLVKYSTEGGYYRIDNYKSPGYFGPEPLRTVFHGLKSLVEQFKSRAVSGDQMCLIFYDDKLSWPRIVKLTSDFDYLEQLVNFDDTAGVDADTVLEGLGDEIAVDSKIQPGRERALRHKLFPSQASFSDTYGAILEALQQLSKKSDDGILTYDSIVHIGDGLANCPMLDRRASELTGNSDWEAYCPNPAGAPNFPNACYNDVANYFCSINMVKSLVKLQAVPRSIPVHIIQVSQDVGPNTVDIADPKNPTQCLQNEAEIRSLGLTANYVMGMNSDGTPWITPPTSTHPLIPSAEQKAAFKEMSSTRPFYQASQDMFEIALMTKGIWGPIRPKKPGCETMPEPSCILTSPPTRRIYDPKCRSTSDQIKEYMSEIMNQNPFTIVDAG